MTDDTDDAVQANVPCTPIIWLCSRGPVHEQRGVAYLHIEEWMTHMARTSFTPVGNSADSPELFLRPLPATGYAAEMLDGEDPKWGYDAEKFPYQ
jgi:hypothetical protein